MGDPRGPVNAEFVYIHPPADGTSPFVQETNIQSKEIINCRVDDVRGREDDYALDTHAFQTFSSILSAAVYETWDSEAEIKRIYYPEVEKLLLDRIPGAHRVIILGYGVRKQSKDGHRQPIHFVHSDHTDQAAKEFVIEHAGQTGVETEKEKLLQHRYRIFSVWRPLNGTVESSPLAFMSATSVDDKDLYPVEMRDHPDYPGSKAFFVGIKHNPHQQWLYWSEMQDDERLVLKCTDTATGVGKRAPHSAFDHVGSSLESKPRESIEVRALVLGG